MVLNNGLKFLFLPCPMPIEGSLLTISQLGLIFAGFTSLFVVVRRPERGQWRPIELIAMWIMVGCSLGALFLSLLPVVLFHYGVSQSALWATSSGTLGLFILVFVGILWNRIRRPRTELILPRANLVFRLLAIVTALTQLLGAVDLLVPRGAPTYVLGLVGLLAMAVFPFIAFLSLIGSDR